MSEYHFGVGRGRISDEECRRVSAIAEKHDATFVRVTLPGEGPRFWFSIRNLGFPFDRAVERAVLKEVGSIEVTLRVADGRGRGGMKFVKEECKFGGVG